MGKTSTAVKDRWNEANYDRFTLRMAKGKKDEYKQQAERKGESLNSYIIRLIEEDIQNDKKSK